MAAVSRWLGGSGAARKLAVALGALLLFALTAFPAFADAPDPIPSATQGSLVTNPDGSRTLTIWGGTDPVTNPGWQWTTHGSDCNTDRSGAGFAIGWNDPTDGGNPLTGKTSSGDTITIGLGTATDNVVHPTPQQVSGKPAAHDVSSPSQYANWRGGCGVYVDHTNTQLPNGTTKSGKWSQGVWGPISHTYPASVKGSISVCPIFYDVHGKETGTAPNGTKEITAGGNNHNGDNSLQSNGSTPQGNGCFTTTFGSPHLSIAKQVSADGGKTWQEQVTVASGATVMYRFVVTNDGENDIDNVHVVDDTGACDGTSLQVVSPSGFTGHLAVGQQATFTCSHVMGSSDLVNVAHAEGVFNSQPVSSPQDTATVHVAPAAAEAPAAQNVLGAREAAPTARLSGPNGCISKAFFARVRGTKISRVVFRLDGKVIARVTKPTRTGVFRVRIRPGKLRIGVHRLVGTVTFKAGSGAKSKTMRLSFQRCGKKLAQPRFTG